jgi:hypothetical protein
MYSVSLAHWNNSPREDVSLHSDILSWFQVNQYQLLLLDAACLAEKQQITHLTVFGFTRTELELTIYRTQCKHA